MEIKKKKRGQLIHFFKTTPMSSSSSSPPWSSSASSSSAWLLLLFLFTRSWKLLITGMRERLAPPWYASKITGRWEGTQRCVKACRPTAGVLLTSVCEVPLTLPGRRWGGPLWPLRLLMPYYWMLTMNLPCLSACLSLCVCLSVTSAVNLHQVP